MGRHTGQGYVYFIRALGGPNLIKIGWTGRSAEYRLASLQSGSPYPLEIIAWVPGTVELEHAYHARFAHLRSFGEWFQESSTLFAAIEEARGIDSPERAARAAELMDRLGEIIATDANKAATEAA